VVSASEAVATARANAEAQRKREVALLTAKQDSEVSSQKLVARAKAEAEASIEQAKATLQNAQSEADSAKLRIATMKEEMETKAKGQKALNEAENALNAEIVALKADLARLEALPRIVEQMVKPAEKIDSIKIHHISGGNTGGGKGSRSKPPVNQALDSIMEMAVQLPALKKIGKELGISVEDGMSSAPPKKDKAKKSS